MQRLPKRFCGILSLTLVISTMLLTGCGKPAVQKELPPAEKEEQRQQLREMSNREQSGK
ncbi:hypothetical protein [Blastopirellula marina]|uniref:hypothetical protein n=1 Tax=Blastopirellula marina TaxID=124 RepID=UPI001304F68A|nr:hypothetical protein [Blastopirellula marina]